MLSMYVQIPSQRPTTTRQRAAPVLLGAAGVVLALSLFLPWLRVESGIFFGAVDRFPDRLDAWQRFAWQDAALLAAALSITGAAVVVAAGRAPRTALTVGGVVSAAATVLVVVEGLGHGQAGISGPGIASLSVGGPPGPGAYVALGACALALIVASAALAREPRRATV
jgi:hypothetical protein